MSYFTMFSVFGLAMASMLSVTLKQTKQAKSNQHYHHKSWLNLLELFPPVDEQQILCDTYVILWTGTSISQV